MPRTGGERGWLRNSNKWNKKKYDHQIPQRKIFRGLRFVTEQNLFGRSIPNLLYFFLTKKVTINIPLSI